MSARRQRAHLGPEPTHPAGASERDGGDDDFEFEVDAEAGEDFDFDFEFGAEELAAPVAASGQRKLDLTPDQIAAIETAAKGLEAKSFYEILLLPHTADAAAVKRAYYKLSKEYHPDRFYRMQLGPYKEQLEVVFNKITEAYRILSDLNTRADYDDMMFPEVGPDTLSHIEAVRGTVGTAPGEATIAVEFVPAALRKKQEAALEARRSQLAEKARDRRKAQKPVFMHNLEKQLAARIAKARRHMEAGTAKQDVGDLQGAVTHFQMAMSLDPRDKKAKAAFKRASSTYRNARAEKFYKEAMDASLSEDFKTAASKLQQAVECKPTKGKYQNELGKLIIEHTLQHRVGLEQLRKAVELEPRNVPYIMDLAGAYADLGMPSNAVRAYERVLQMDRKNAAATKALKKLN